jgi:myo-inositol-1(or 4)-monophosphatase
MSDADARRLLNLALCAVSLSLVHNGISLMGVVDLPFLATQYSALRGHGAYVGGKKIRVSPTRELNAALVSIDQYAFGEDFQYKNSEAYSRVAPEVERDNG